MKSHMFTLCILTLALRDFVRYERISSTPILQESRARQVADAWINLV
jgi:hypothetical protein